ncbi:hypothetical protein SAMN05443551_1714 [Marivita hallyeonensis]|uniref:Uncharacterized protein n=1 Tax=Marivita hallyeonensis TaxID=996342 RepID=A0A1M5RD38_9RHOB|nr:hypothetical protein SAMN05443551_1714 [Marivita hallyeonensis]
MVKINPGSLARQIAPFRPEVQGAFCLGRGNAVDWNFFFR